jgi:hypothetical protein
MFRHRKNRKKRTGITIGKKKRRKQQIRVETMMGIKMKNIMGIGEMNTFLKIGARIEIGMTIADFVGITSIPMIIQDGVIVIMRIEEIGAAAETGEVKKGDVETGEVASAGVRSVGVGNAGVAIGNIGKFCLLLFRSPLRKL